MMKTSRQLLTALMAVAAFAASAKFSVDRIDPPYWWAGMKNASLQLQVQGKDIRPADFSVDYPGVTVDSVVRLDGSPNWQYVYLNISPQAQPGTITLRWKEGRHTLSRKYELKKREPSRGAQGFSAADVLYMIMPDRFADGNPDNNRVESMRYPIGADRSNPNVRHGGDLKGVVDHLAYLDTLGITAVWLNPVLENDMPGGSYHGYATTDYYAIDPRFGSNDEYRAMIDTLHSHGIKTVMDMIFNHSGSAHPWMLDPPSSDWFNNQGNFVETNHKLGSVTDPYAADVDRSGMLEGWFVREMPDLNQRNPHLMKYLVQNSIFWIEDAGIDGIRMDTYPYADKDAMGQWVDAVLAEYPDFNIVGECWFSEPAAVAAWQTGSPFAGELGDTRLPVVMDFPLMVKSRELKPYTEETTWGQGLNTIYNHLALDYVYADPMNVLRFLDNHDTERMILEVPENLDSWKQAQLLLLTVPGIPQIYYGTELLMAGSRQGGDGNVRKDMPGGFPGDTATVFTREGRTPLQNEAFDFLSTILNWRKTSKAVAEGTMKHFAPDNKLYVYERRAGDDVAIVILNGSDSLNEVDMRRYAEILEPDTPYLDLLTGKELIPLPSDGTVTWSPRAAHLLLPLLK